MATIRSIDISPNAVPHGGTATVKVSLSLDPGDPGREATVTVAIDGETGTGKILVGERDPEVVKFSTDLADAGKPGICVVTVDEGSLDAEVEEGAFLFTAA